MTMPAPRMNWYAYSDFGQTQYGVTHEISGFIEAVGFYPLSARIGTLKMMQRFNVAILLFSMIFNIILLIFIVISVLLIYSLLMIGVETKTFETGIMRMVGISKRGLMTMIFLQSLMFVIPAIILAIIMCFPMLALCYKFIFLVKLDNGFEPVPSGKAAIFALLVGILIPLLSSIIPLLKVLGQNLNDALNYERNRVKAIYVQILDKTKSNIIP
jgi:ABC-type antimicrobial peptide transport system permease subunit